MNILVSGASGFIGQPLMMALAGAGHVGVAVSRRTLSELPKGWNWLERSRVLGDQARFAAPNCVIHMEVKQHIQQATLEDLAQFKEVNVLGTQKWLDWSTRHQVRQFIYFSTIKAVGESGDCQDESGATEPTTPYGRSKRDAEELVREWARKATERSAIILRPAVVYGPGGQGNMHVMMEAIRRGIFRVVGKGDNVKSVVSVNNVVASVPFLLGREFQGCQTFNLVDRQSYPVRDLALMIELALGVSGKVKSIPLPIAKAVAKCGDLVLRMGGRFPINSSRLKALSESTHFSVRRLLDIGFVHPQTTEEGIREMVYWYMHRSI